MTTACHTIGHMQKIDLKHQVDQWILTLKKLEKFIAVISEFVLKVTLVIYF